MKYYIYVSDMKIDMLYPQIPHDQKTRIAKELKIDLKLISASIKEEKELKETRYSKAKLISRYIINNCQVGTVDEPKDYIYDTLEIKWGPYGFGRKSSPLVYFGGKTDLTILGMGGSAHHIIGAIGNSNPHSHSLTPILLSYLRRQLVIQQDDKIENLAKKLVRRRDDVSKDQEEKEAALHAVELATTQMKGLSERLEFLAKTLLIGSRYRLVVLATPIYVALANII